MTRDYKFFVILLIVLFSTLTIFINMNIYKNIEFTSKEANLVQLMSSNPIISIKKIEKNKFVLLSMNTSVTRRDTEFDVRFCNGRIDIVTINSQGVIREWNYTLEKFRIFSHPCIADFNGDGKNDFIVAIQDDPNHYLNNTEVVAFISKNKNYEEKNIITLKNFFVYNISFAKIGNKGYILLAGLDPGKRLGKILVLENSSIILEKYLGNVSFSVIPIDINNDGNLDLIVPWHTLSNGSFISVFINDHLNFNEVKRIKLFNSMIIAAKYIGNGNLLVNNIKEVYQLNIKNHRFANIYESLKSEYIIDLNVKNDIVSLLIYNESDKVHPFRILRLRHDALSNSYLKVSEIKLDITPVLSVYLDESILIGSEKGLYLVRV